MEAMHAEQCYQQLRAPSMRRLQSQLRSLAALCWCLSHQHGGQQLGGEVGSPGDNGSGGPGPAARWEGFPRGAPLLSYLHQALLEAGARGRPALNTA